MKKKLEAFKIEFAKTLQDSDYKFICDYDQIETCIEVICNSDLIPRKTKFKFFKFKGNERILIQANKRFLIEYSILQNGIRFELYEISLSKYNEFERQVNELL
jgi:hypothetical protein